MNGLEKEQGLSYRRYLLPTLALSSSYLKLAYQVKDNDATKVILNYIFSSTLKQGFSLPRIINGQEILINNVIAQINDPILQYIIDNLQDRNLAENKFISEKINGIINSIYSVVEPGKNVNNFHDLLGFILVCKEIKCISYKKQILPAIYVK